MLLSQNDDAINVGQIRDLPSAMRKNAPCSCGNPLKQCEFWKPIVRDLPGKRPLAKLIEGYKEFRKAARNAGPWNDAQVRARLIEDHGEYLKKLAKLYHTAAQHAGNRTLVDSSKSPEIALALGLVEGFDLYILNLVRDPRAVVCSWKKKTDDLQRLAGRAREWKLRQEWLSQLGQLQPDHFKLLRYEDLTSAPRETIEQLLGWAKLDTSTTHFVSNDKANVSWNDLHLFPPANEGVLKAKATSIKIRTADSWRKPENSELHAIGEEEAFPEAEAYGYSR